MHLDDVGSMGGCFEVGTSAALGGFFPPSSFGGGRAKQRWLWETDLVRQHLRQVFQARVV